MQRRNPASSQYMQACPFIMPPLKCSQVVSLRALCWPGKNPWHGAILLNGSGALAADADGQGNVMSDKKLCRERCPGWWPS